MREEIIIGKGPVESLAMSRILRGISFQCSHAYNRKRRLREIHDKGRAKCYKGKDEKQSQLKRRIREIKMGKGIVPGANGGGKGAEKIVPSVRRGAIPISQSHKSPLTKWGLQKKK